MGCILARLITSIASLSLSSSTLPPFICSFSPPISLSLSSSSLSLFLSVSASLARAAPLFLVFIPRGINVAALDEKKKWAFTFTDGRGGRHREGDIIAPGDQWGVVYENEYVSKHKILCPPNVQGKIVQINASARDGHEEFDITETIMVVEDVARQQKHELKLAHLWPVRVPRPVKEKLPGNAALVTGQRV